MPTVAELGEDEDLVLEGEGVFFGEFGAFYAFDGVGAVGGGDVFAPFYYGECSRAQLVIFDFDIYIYIID